MQKPVKQLKFFLKSLLEIVTIRVLLRPIIIGTLAFALPEGGQVITGGATITSPNPQTVQINQQTDKSIIEWRSFNIGGNEKTQFVQPSPSAIALNRINAAQGVSQIYGQLLANGRIILINAAGIYFGPSAYVNVGGIIATTSNMSNENFMAGKYIFDQPSRFGGSVINEGNIEVQDKGLAMLAGTGVSNTGTIKANLGTVVLASGNKFTVDFYGDQLINFTINEPVSRAGVDQHGKPLKSGVSNTGKIIANGGTVLITASAAHGVLDNVINMEGYVEARSAKQQNGVIILSGGDEGTVKVAGHLDVSSRHHQGGTIKVLGKNIHVASTAVLKARGKTKGGTVLIGGNVRGTGPEQNAEYTYVAPGAKIIANARVSGDGGKVVVWSNKDTRFYGNIDVRGGAKSGNGGWVETSSKNFLDVNGGTVNATAPYGKTGTWLLDPTNMYIALNQTNATAAGMTGTDISANTSTGVNPATFAGTGTIQDSLLTTGNLATALGTANVIVTTTNPSGTGLGNITVVDPLSWSSANTLTLTAANNILINAAIQTGAPGSALILNAVGNMTQTAGISGSGGLIQLGTGTSTLSQANTYSGPTTVNAGSLILSGAGTAVNSSGWTVNQGSTLALDNTTTNILNRISGPLTLNSGEFIFKGTNVAATNASESLGALNLPTGQSTITTIAGSGGSTTLTFDSINRSTGATVLFRGDNLGGTPGAGVTNMMFTTPTGLNLTGTNTSQVNKRIVPFAIGDTSSSGSGIGFVTYNISPLNNTANTTGIRPLNLATEYTTATGTAGVNLKLDTASVSPNVNRAFNSLLFSGGRTFTIGSGGGGKTLTITSGAVFSAPGAANAITGRATDTLQLGTAEAKFFTLGDFAHNTSLFAGTGGLTKSGPGVFLENSSVAVSGGITVNAGTLRLGVANAFATNQPLTVRALGTYDLNNFADSITTLLLESGATSGANVTTGTGTLTLGGNVTLNAIGSGATGANISGNLALGANRLFTINDGTANNDLTISALVSGATFSVTKAGSGTLQLSNIANTYTGQTIINAGTLSVPVLANTGTVSSIGTGVASSIINIGSTGVLRYTGTGHSTNRGIALTASGGTIEASGTGDLTLSGGITGNTFGLVLTGTGTGIESGVIGTTTGTLTKNGTGIWILSGANTYSGATTINAGQLSLGNIGALGSTSSTTVLGTGAALDLAFNNGTLTNTNLINLNGTGIGGTGALTMTGISDRLNNPITLQSSSTIGGTGTGTFTLGGPITGTNTDLTINLTNAGLSLPTTTLNTSGNLSVTTNGAIVQTGALTIPGTASFAAGGTNDITLSSANNFGTATITSANNVILNDINALNLGGATILGNLNVTTAGDITQSGAITSTLGKIATFGAGSGNNIILSGANDFKTVAITSGNDVTLNDINQLILGTSTISGNLNVTTSGDITQSGPLTVNGINKTATFAAGASNNITLSAANDFTNIGITSANDVILNDINALNFNASTISNNLTVTTAGAITQSAPITVSGPNKFASFTAGSGNNITLTNPSNDFSRFMIGSGNDVNITDINGIVLNASTISGNFTLNTNGSITQNGAIIANGINKISTFNAGSTGDINLSTTANDFTKVVIQNALSANIHDLNDLVLGLINVIQNFTAEAGGNLTTQALMQTAGGNVNLATTGPGTITIDTSGIKTSLNGISPGGSITITAANTSDLNPIIIVNGVLDTRGGTGGVLILGGHVQLNSAPLLGASNVTINGQSGATILGNLTFTVPTTIQIVDSDIIINGSIISTGAGSDLIFFADSNNNNLGGIRVTSLGSVNSSSNLMLKGSNLFVNPSVSIELQTGSSLQAAGTISLLGNVGNSDIVLNGDIQSTGASQPVTVTPAGTGKIQLGANIITNAGSINLNNRVTLIGTSALTSNGGVINIPGAISGVGQTLSLAAGSGTDINLTNASNDFGTLAITSGRDVQLLDINRINLGASTISGNFILNAAGDITQSGALSINGIGKTATFAAGPTNNITLSNINNDFTTVAVTSGNDVVLNDLNALNLGTSTISGNLDVITQGAITQSGPLTVSGAGNRATFTAGSGNNITLGGANDFITAAINSGNDVILNDINALNIGTSNISGNLNVTSAGDMTQIGSITANGIGKIATFSAGTANNIIFNNSNDFTTVGITTGHNVTLNDINALNLAASTLTGNLDVTTAGAITQSGALTVPGTSSFSSSASPITLTLSNNALTGAVTLSNTGANDVSLTTSGALQLAASDIGRNLTAIAGNGITLSGAITAGNSIVLSGTQFTNNAGVFALNTGTGSFLVWSGNPANDNRGGLTYNFKQYNATYGVTPVQGTGSGFLYTIAPVVTPSLTGIVTKSYTGTTDATLTGSNYAVSGVIDSDTVTLNNPSSGTYGSANVGTNINIAVSGLAIGSATNGSATVYGYQLVPTTANANIGQITQAPLTVTANNANKLYGQTVTFTGTEFTPTGLQNSETVGSVTLTSSGAISTANVAGSPYAIVASAATGGTFNPANYSITYTDGALTINPASLTIAANDALKTYGQTVAFTGSEFTPTGLQNSETVGSVTLTSGGAISTANVAGSPYAIVASAATGGTFNPANYSITYTDGALTVNPASLTIAANNANKTYGQTMTFTGSEFTPTGLQNSETVGSVTLTSGGTISTANVAGSPYAIVASAATGGTFNPANYSITYRDGALTVNPASLTIAANDALKTYGQTVAFTGSEFTPTGLQNSETVGSVTLTSGGAISTANVAGSPYAIVASAATGGTFNPANYSITYTDGALTVNPASLTIAANDALKTYGQTVAFTGSEFTHTGLQNSETIGTVTLTSGGAISTANVAGSPYAIVPSAATGGTFNPANYSITYTNGVLTVNPASLTIAANNTNKTYGQTVAFTGSEFTPSGLQNSETVGNVTLTSGGTISTANVAGSPYAIVASAATGGTFNPANYSITYTDGALTVNPASLTIAANNANKTYGQTTTFTGNEFTPTGLQNSETVGSVTLTSGGTISTANVAGSPYAIVASAATGGTFNPANYTVNYVSGNLTVNPATLTYIANKASRVGGTANPALSGTVEGYVLGQTQATATIGNLVFNTSAAPSSVAGNYPIIGSGLRAKFDNYIFTQAAGNLTALTVTQPVPVPPVPAPPVPVPVPTADKGLVANVISSVSGGTGVSSVMTDNRDHTAFIINNMDNTMSVFPSGITASVTNGTINIRETAIGHSAMQNVLNGLTVVKTIKKAEEAKTIKTTKGVKSVIIAEGPIMTALPQVQMKPLKETMMDFHPIEILIMITILGLLELASIIVVIAMLLRIQTATTNALAKTLTLASYNNYLERRKHPDEVIPITNSLDTTKLLPEGLPEGYQITPAPVSRGDNAVCILIGPLDTKAFFIVIGISPYYSTNSRSVSA